MNGLVNAFASIMQEVSMRKRDTFMHPPHGDWLICMALTIKHCAFHGMTFEAILNHALESPPKEGWNEENTLLLELMIKHFMKVQQNDVS